MRLCRYQWVLITLLLCACGEGNPWFSISVDYGPFPVGSTATGIVYSRTCREGQFIKDCPANTIQLLSLRSEPEGIIEVTATEGPNTVHDFTLRMLAEGTANLIVVANDGHENKTFVEAIEVLTVNGVNVRVEDEFYRTCPQPVLYATDESDKYVHDHGHRRWHRADDDAGFSRHHAISDRRPAQTGHDAFV